VEKLLVTEGQAVNAGEVLAWSTEEVSRKKKSKTKT